MLYATITTIQSPTQCVHSLIERLAECDARLIVVGDTKGPTSFDVGSNRTHVEFMTLADQNRAGFAVTTDLPTAHYARKNVAYLQAMKSGATCIYETDDDNAPNENWAIRSEYVSDCSQPSSSDRNWVNVYRYFTDQVIWPRGLPLDKIHQPLADLVVTPSAVQAPIQQGLVNGSPDVDAIWRLVMDKPFDFDNRSGVYLPPGAWCPFNTQSTWWWPVAYPLMYVPSYCSFRMCDIWKSFIAQRCLWAMNLGVVFHAPEVNQDRNEHDLQTDFNQEVDGYLQNDKISNILDNVELDSCETAVGSNMVRCYEALVNEGIFPNKEMGLVSAWVEDCEKFAKV